MSQNPNKKLIREIIANTEDIEALLEDYSAYVGEEQAAFIRSYSVSLARDFEVAMTRGALNDLEIIVEDLQDLRANAQQRLFEVKSLEDVKKDLNQD